MEIEEALFNYLSNYAELTALIGSQIYPMRLPQSVDLKENPAVTYTRISGPGIHLMGGDANLTSPRFQFSVWAKKYSSAVNVTKTLKKALQDYSGIMGGASGVKVQHIYLENEIDASFEPDPEIYHRILDFIIWHEE